MTSDDGHSSVFERMRGHDGREIIDETRKLTWRHTTLQSDFRDLNTIYEKELPYSRDRSQQLKTQGYVFEFERRLHHYLSGLFTLVQQQSTLQDGVGQSFRNELQQVKNEYMSKESSRTVLGLRHYVQHENVIPLQPRTSKLTQSRSLVVMIDELHRTDDDRNFEQHFGHINKPYFDPVEYVIDNWQDVEEFFDKTVEVIEQQAKGEIRELEQLSERVDELNEQVAEAVNEMDSE